MPEFVQNPVNIIILSLVILLVALCIYSLVKDRKKGCSACGKNCSGCSMACHLQECRDQLKANRKEAV
ncbi:MAG: FeoB-associated Cys-rich membrane protein [Solobacterium sp.]|nr:FeoB-associated Cys-rich membrane protein [Solobacterium sp.]